MDWSQSVQTEWARLLIGSLVQAGIQNIVISPGSRSTPLVAAAISHPKLRTWSVVDERSAGFFALGQARATAEPSVLLCTSGSAGSHYYPAVLEAEASGLPLVIITADRPPEMQNCGAAQTLDQRALYGGHARDFVDLPLPDPSPQALRALRRRCLQAVEASRWPKPGAVQINVPARKPLEPAFGGGLAGDSLRLEVQSILDGRSIAIDPPELLPAQSIVQQIVSDALSSKSGLIVAGPGPRGNRCARADVRELSKLTDFPFLPDLASQWSQVNDCPSTLDLFFAHRKDLALPAPEFLLQIGTAPTSSSFSRWLNEDFTGQLHVISEDRWTDPSGKAQSLLRAPITRSLEALVESFKKVRRTNQENDFSDDRRSFANHWRVAKIRIEEAKTQVLKFPEAQSSEGRLVKDFLASLPDESDLVLGNSLAIRMADTWNPGIPATCSVFSQRGLMGIDGLISGALGCASLRHRPTGLLLGDLSLLHDLTALATPSIKMLKAPLVVCVLNNRGGRIFEQLPLASSADIAEEDQSYWTTPQNLDLASVAQALGVHSERVEEGGDAVTAFEQAWSRPGLSLVEVLVPPHAAARLSQALANTLKNSGSSRSRGIPPRSSQEQR